MSRQPTAWKVRTPPEPQNVVPVDPAGPHELPKAPPERLTTLDLRPPGDRDAYFLTGHDRSEAVALIWTNIPDGKRRMVGALLKYEVEAILKNWPTGDGQ